MEAEWACSAAQSRSLAAKNVGSEDGRHCGDHSVMAPARASRARRNEPRRFTENHRRARGWLAFLGNIVLQFLKW